MSNPAIVELSAVDNTSHAFQSAQNNLQQFERNSRRAGQQMDKFGNSNRMARAGVQQLGYQVQDIAVQLQAGQSPFIVLSQQGSQIASLFGPSGAVVGAMVAVGSIIASALLPSLFKTEKQTETLEERVRGLGKSYDELGAAQKEWLSIQQRATEAQKADEIALIEAELAKAKAAEASAERSRSMQEELRRTQGDEIAEQMNVVIAAYERTASKQDELSATLETARAELAALQERWQELVDPHEKAEAEVTKIIEALREEVATLGMSETAIALYTLRKNEATEAQIAEATALRAAIDLKEEQEKVDKAAAKAAEEAAKARDKAASDLATLQQSFFTEQQMVSLHAWGKVEIAQAALDQGLINAQEYADLEVAIAAERQRQLAEIDNKQADSVRTAQEAVTRALSDNLNRQVNSLAAAFDESSSIGKAFYAVQQAMAAANAIISGYAAAASIREAYAKLAAATGNPALAAGGEAQAAVSIGLGYATAGAIAGQTLASFDGGGFTGYGARAGGMDGKGGFAAMLHPNETVVDHAKGGGRTSVNITIQANDTRGFDQLLLSRRGYITRLINEAVNNQGRRALV